MKAYTPRASAFLTIAVAALIAAGCAGGTTGTGSMPPASTSGQPARAAAPASGHLRPMDNIACPTHHTCGYLPLLTLAYNGTGFTEVLGWWQCFPDFWQVPVYTAPSSGLLALGGTVSLASNCTNFPFAKRATVAVQPMLVPGFTPTPSPAPAPTATPSPTPTQAPGGNGSLYVIAYQVGWDNNYRLRMGKKLKSNDQNTFGPVAVAGPASLSSNPWVFAPIAGALNLQANNHYVFFVAQRFDIPDRGWGW
jgi:hypothetical protein